MTNNIDLTALGAPDVEYKVPDTFKMTHHADGSVTTEGIETLPWSTDHLICSCGHKWTEHDGLGCLKCPCEA